MRVSPSVFGVACASQGLFPARVLEGYVIKAGGVDVRRLARIFAVVCGQVSARIFFFRVLKSFLLITMRHHV